MKITHTLVREILSGCVDDDPVLGELVSALAEPVPQDALVKYLFDDDLVAQALIKRLREDPDGTLDDLSALASEGTASGRSRSRGSKASRKQSSQTRRQKSTGTARRERVSDISGLKRQVVDFLSRNPQSSRKAIEAAVVFPSESVYNRVIGTLRKDGTIASEGERWRMVYSVVHGNQGTEPG